jgi:hypothetical protein
MEGNNLHIQSPSLSRFHAQLHTDEQMVWIIDLNSSFGVQVDGVRIPPNQWTPLPPGSAAVLGSLTLRTALAGASPAAAAAGRPPAPARPAAAPSPRSATARVARPSRARPLALLGVLGVLLLCGFVVIAGGAVWAFFPDLVAGLLPGGGSTAGGPSLAGQPAAVEPTPAPPTVLQTHTLGAGQRSFSDENGASLSVPGEALPPEEVLTLQTAALGSTMQADLEQAFTIETPAYSVAAAGVDGAGRAQLSLPAPSPDSRLAVLVEDQYLALLPITPQDGVLNVQPFIGAPQASQGYPTLAQATQPNRYFVITPKAGAYQAPARRARLAGLAQQPDIVNCIPRIWHGNRCWSNQSGSVMVLFSSSEIPAGLANDDVLRPPEVIDGLIRAISGVMSAYQQAGFSNAAISGSNPVYLIISAKESEPNYSQKTGNVYLGWGVVQELASGSGKCTIAHELMHWVEDESYAMNVAALDNDKAWWLEMAAENGSFLIDTACIGGVLSTYGVAEVGDLLAWQAAPFQWDWGEGSRYVQSLQMYLSICDNGSRCAIGSREFADLITRGSYPSGSARDAYARNADDMGRYLLGANPLLARGDPFMPPAVKSGSGYGDYIWLKTTAKPTIDTSLAAARIKKTGDFEVTASSTIAHGGVYPLWVSNGKGTPMGGADGFTGLPGMLTVSPGAPLWYSLDNGGPVFHDGSKELVLGPLSDKLGVGLVRLVATAPDGEKSFQAVVKPVDLSGDWANLISNSKITRLDCPGQDDSPEAIDFVAFLGGYGAYVPDPAVKDGSRYIWEGSIPDSQGATIDSEIEITPDKITLTYLIDVPQPETNSRLPWLVGGLAGLGKPPGLFQPAGRPGGAALIALPAGLALLLALLGLSSRRGPGLAYARAGSAALALLLIGVWLSGCAGFALWGTFEGTYTYTRLRQAEAESLPAEAAELNGVKWVLEGTSQIAYDLTLLVEVGDGDGAKETRQESCAVSFETSLTGLVGPADMVSLPQE